MTQSPLDRYVDDFGGQLLDAQANAGSASRERRLHRLPAGIALLAAAVTAVVLVWVLGGGATTPDAVAKALAALETNGRAVYMDVEPQLPPSARATSASRWQLWLDQNKHRWRMVQVRPQGRDEFAYDNGIQAYYDVANNRLSFRQGFSEHGPAARDPLDASRTLNRLRSLLAAGRVRDAGETTKYGRRVHKLVAHMPSRVLDRTTIYYADAKTFAPVAAEIIIRFRPKHSSPPREGRRTSRLIDRSSFVVRTYRVLDSQPASGDPLRISVPRSVEFIRRVRPRATPQVISARAACRTPGAPFVCR